MNTDKRGWEKAFETDSVLPAAGAGSPRGGSRTSHPPPRFPPSLFEPRRTRWRMRRDVPARKAWRLWLVLIGGGAWAAAARAQAGGAIRCVAIDTGGFRCAKVSDIREVNFLPGAAKYGDLPGILALGAAGKLWVAGQGAKPPELIEKMYGLLGAESDLSIAGGRQGSMEAVEWLLKQP